MKPVEIKKDLYWVGALDPDLRIFDVIMRTNYGTSYNSYLIKGSDKTALSETVKDCFFDEYLKNLQSLVKVENLDYIIVNHTEPDHTGSLAYLLKVAKNAKVVGSNAAIKFLKQIVNEPFDFIQVKGGESIDLGGKTLQFISAPFLHWPDSIYTYLKEDQILLSCDSFGCHYSSEKIFNDLIEKDFLESNDLLDAYKYYFEMIMSPFKPYVLQAIEKIRNLPIQIICPGHGPVLRDNLWKYVDLYEKWSLEGPQVDDKEKRVTISYVSAYGYTASLAEKIAEGIKSVGDFQIYLYDIIHTDVDDILEKIAYSQGVLFGSPTVNRDALKPVWDLIAFLNPIIHGNRLAAAFGSYGWSGEAVGVLEARLQNLKFKVLPGLKINFKPSKEELEKAFQFGAEFGNALVHREKI